MVPGVLDVVDELPGLLHLVTAREKGGVSGDGIQQQPFVGFRAGFPKQFLVLSGTLTQLDIWADRLLNAPTLDALIAAH